MAYDDNIVGHKTLTFHHVNDVVNLRSWQNALAQTYQKLHREFTSIVQQFSAESRQSCGV